MKNARYTASEALMRLCRDGAYSNLVIDALSRKYKLSARDSAFAHALFYTSVERLLTIDHILSQYSARPLGTMSPQVLSVLRCAVAQLVWMEGVDDFAAVSEAVNLTRVFGQAKASGLVNGILRSFLRDEKRIPPVKGDEAKTLEVEYSCPAWLIREWLACYGREATIRLLTRSLGKPPLYLRVNTQKTTSAALLERLRADGIECELEPSVENSIRVDGHIDIEGYDGFQDGLFHVQDLASQICAGSLGAQPGEDVLDVCSAPGGKSFTIAQQMQDSGRLIARDLHPKRTALVEKGALRLGLSCVKAIPGDASVFDPKLGSFDRILCDVPCSGFGIIRRKPEIKYKTRDQIKNLPDIQYKILEISSQYLKQGGTLVYSTCTLLTQENEDICTLFLKEHAQFALVSQKTYTGQEADTDGFYTAVFEKR